MNKILILIISISLMACGVPKKKYADLEDQAKSCETSFAAAEKATQSCQEALAKVSTTKIELETKTKTYEDLMTSLKSEVDQGKVKISEMKDRLTVNLVDKILFDSGKTEIKEEGKATISKIAEVLKPVKDKRIQVEGHTDNAKIGPTLQKKFPTNWELSTARATVVVKYLAELGVPETMLSASGYSMFSPVASNDTDEGRQQNRRIEIVLLPLLPVAPVVAPAPTVVPSPATLPSPAPVQ